MYGLRYTSKAMRWVSVGVHSYCCDDIVSSTVPIKYTLGLYHCCTVYAAVSLIDTVYAVRFVARRFLSCYSAILRAANVERSICAVRTQ